MGHIKNSIAKNQQPVPQRTILEFGYPKKPLDGNQITVVLLENVIEALAIRAEIGDSYKWKKNIGQESYKFREKPCQIHSLSRLDWLHWLF